ncbi:MAG: DsrE/DsrF/DrsH-like family protein [Euryarchaeota archaeon]|nr:DsrE/DsrF/DrsH-like family protein [Euryarchaeota archaeon]
MQEALSEVLPEPSLVAPRRLAIVAHSGTWDKLYQVVALATSGVTMGYEVHVFLSFWALRRFAEEDLDKVDVPASEASHQPRLARGMPKARILPLGQMLQEARDLGPVRLYACSTSARIFGLEPPRFKNKVDEVLGLTAFLERAEGGWLVFV